MKCVLLGILLAAPAPVQEKIAPPQGPPPSYAIALMKDGKLTLQQSVLIPENRTETRQRIVIGGRHSNWCPIRVTVVVYRTVLQPVQVDKAQFYDTAGKEIDAPRAARLLSKQQVVLVSADNKPLDPFYLRTVKEGTLIVRRPMTSGPPVAPDLSRPIPQPLPPFRPK